MEDGGVSLSGSTVTCSFDVDIWDHGSLRMKESKGKSCRYEISIGDETVCGGPVENGGTVAFSESLSDADWLSDGTYGITLTLSGGDLTGEYSYCFDRQLIVMEDGKAVGVIAAKDGDMSFRSDAAKKAGRTWMVMFYVGFMALFVAAFCFIYAVMEICFSDVLSDWKWLRTHKCDDEEQKKAKTPHDGDRRKGHEYVDICDEHERDCGTLAASGGEGSGTGDAWATLTALKKKIKEVSKTADGDMPVPFLSQSCARLSAILDGSANDTGWLGGEAGFVSSYAPELMGMFDTYLQCLDECRNEACDPEWRKAKDGIEKAVDAFIGALEQALSDSKKARAQAAADNADAVLSAMVMSGNVRDGSLPQIEVRV